MVGVLHGKGGGEVDDQIMPGERKSFTSVKCVYSNPNTVDLKIFPTIAGYILDITGFSK